MKGNTGCFTNLAIFFPFLVSLILLFWRYGLTYCFGSFFFFFFKIHSCPTHDWASFQFFLLSSDSSVFFFFFSCDGSHFVFFFNGSDMPHQPLKLTLSARSSHMKCFLHLQFFFLHPFKLREHLFWNLVFLECKFLHSGLGGRSNLRGGRSNCHIIA